MGDFEWRLAVYALWALACVISWGKVFADAYGQYRTAPAVERRHEQRQREWRELVSDFALLLTSGAAFLSLVVLIIGQEIVGVRGFFLAVALGAFVGAGIIRAWPGRRSDV